MSTTEHRAQARRNVSLSFLFWGIVAVVIVLIALGLARPDLVALSCPEGQSWPAGFAVMPTCG